MTIYSPVASEMTDRVDVLRSGQAVEDSNIRALDEQPVALDVPCKIVEVSGYRSTMMLGTQQQNAYTAQFYAEPIIRQNDVLLVRATGARYVVNVARCIPSPHACETQVVEMTQDRTQPVPR